MNQLKVRALALSLSITAVSGCGYNSVVQRDEEVKAAWAEVESQYQRRADLVPNLVSTVKGASSFEQKTLQDVIEARAKATSVRIDASIIDDPARLAAFDKAQQTLGGALGRLLVVSEAYPDLKASAAYRDLMAQLEGTENRITVARGRYIDSVARYNTEVQTFPTMIGAKLRHRAVRPTFTANPAAANVPAVDLSVNP